MNRVPLIGPLIAWAYRHRRKVADWTAPVAFGLSVWLGWRVVGYPWSDGGHDRRLLYGGLVVAAAFLIAAMVQRVLMGQYALKAGPFEMKAIKEVTVASQETARVTEGILHRLDLLEAALAQDQADLAQLEESVVEALDRIVTLIPEAQGP